ncbi:hypothetical protein [Halobacillus litoralis]|uniref:hypothetical protein n=1 Tax=Halobacillus litoralis TaxID=45668 RepID=UPI001CFCCB76|nr:hypothetical protein [Halobacillus litoralis]
MVVLLLIVVALYSSLMVYLLAKVGCAPAESVIERMKDCREVTPMTNKQRYEQSISAR